MDPLVSLHYYAPVCAVINACIIPFTEGLAPFTHLDRLGPFVMFTNAGIAFALNVSSRRPCPVGNANGLFVVRFLPSS